MNKRNIGAYIQPVYAGYSAITANATAQAAVTSASIDRLGYESAKIALAYTTTLADTKTLSFLIKTSQSSDNSTFATAATAMGITVATTGTTGGPVKTGVVELDLNIAGYDRYFKVEVTPSFSSTATDTATWMGQAILGGKDKLPA